MSAISRSPTMSADAVSVSTDFDIFAHRPVQTSILETTETTYKHTTSVDQSDLDFLVPADNGAYIDLNLHLYLRRKLTESDGADMDNTDFTAVANNFLHSLFSQCSITLNGVMTTTVMELYHYRAYLETADV